jgi:N-acetylglucosaminyl-diphospho-decaprenol L-rhamnosyltransferase
MTFTVVVVAHDSREDLVRLLASLDAHVGGDPQVVVVDSGSTDDGAEAAREWGAEVVSLGNVGFGAANDAGVAVARHDVTVLVNPDVLALDGGLRALAALPERYDALYAPRLLNEDRTVQRTAHAVPGTWRELLPAVVHPRLLPERARLRTDPWRSDEPVEVGWAIAACLAARTETLRRLGPFDPEVFLYGEDMDLCLRARAAGVPTVYWPAVTLVHAGGTSAEAAFGAEPHALKAERRRAVVGATRGRAALARDDAAQALTFATRAGARLALGRDASRERAQLAALRQARRTP